MNSDLDHLVHVGDHQQQTLRSGVGGGQSTSGQRAVDGTCSTSFGLHLNNLDGVAKDVLPAGSRPLINVVGHGAGRGDGIDASYFAKCVADVGGSGIAVHSFEFSCQNKIPPKVFKFRPVYHSTSNRICKAFIRVITRKNMEKRICLHFLEKWGMILANI